MDWLGPRKPEIDRLEPGRLTAGLTGIRNQKRDGWDLDKLKMVWLGPRQLKMVLLGSRQLEMDWLRCEAKDGLAGPLTARDGLMGRRGLGQSAYTGGAQSIAPAQSIAHGQIGDTISQKTLNF